jgi:hypothetical protein
LPRSVVLIVDPFADIVILRSSILQTSKNETNGIDLTSQSPGRDEEMPLMRHKQDEGAPTVLF